MRRAPRWDRVAVAAAATWTLALAVVTLFPYQTWFTGAGYEVLQDADALGSSGAVAEIAGVIRVYGTALIVAAAVTGLLAWRLGERAPRAGLWWLGACVLGALLTRDVVGVLLFVVALALVLARSRARGRVERAAVPAPATGGTA